MKLVLKIRSTSSSFLKFSLTLVINVTVRDPHNYSMLDFLHWKEKLFEICFKKAAKFACMLLTYILLQCLWLDTYVGFFVTNLRRKKLMVWVAYMKGYMITKSQHYTLIKKKIKFSSYICKEIPNGAVAKSYMRKGFLWKCGNAQILNHIWGGR